MKTNIPILMLTCSLFVTLQMMCPVWPKIALAFVLGARQALSAVPPRYGCATKRYRSEWAVWLLAVHRERAKAIMLYFVLQSSASALLSRWTIMPQTKVTISHSAHLQGRLQQQAQAGPLHYCPAGPQGSPLPLLDEPWLNPALWQLLCFISAPSAFRPQFIECQTLPYTLAGFTGNARPSSPANSTARPLALIRLHKHTGNAL